MVSIYLRLYKKSQVVIVEIQLRRIFMGSLNSQSSTEGNTNEHSMHPFPIKVAYQTLRFIQGTIFYFTLTDEAAGQFFSQSNGYNAIKNLFVNGYNYSETTWETSWNCFEEYVKRFPNQYRLETLISMKSHWDWYISQIGNFLIFALAQDNTQKISPKEIESSKKIGFADIGSQFKILKKITGLEFNLSDVDIQTLSEMALVRNLGIHNQWEVDDYYIKWTKEPRWKRGQIRRFGIEELNIWHKTLITAINQTSVIIAQKYFNAPQFVS